MDRATTHRAVGALLLALMLSALVAGCAPKPVDGPYGYSETGYASWYGPGFHGKRTASGEIYNMYDYTAAHKQLPFGTLVQVENLENHKVVAVRINDRGPFVRGRIIDLSYTAAQDLNMIRAGVVKVRIQVMPATQLPTGFLPAQQQETFAAIRGF
ncbi:MAG: septal ring lytic transglycosylase RlpA family protein [Candidatus Alcyoniella australis]|nr:septal ring lytic transglycosylase RlpA family protein [Candidatus Alcyoniella australis]